MTFIRYAVSQMVSKTNNCIVLRSKKIKEPTQGAIFTNQGFVSEINEIA